MKMDTGREVFQNGSMAAARELDAGKTAQDILRAGAEGL